MCLLCWILMHWKQDLCEIEYLYSRWERSRLALALGRHSANHSHTSESQLPSCEKREKLCPREKFNVLQTNSKLFCIYSYHFIFCANEGAAGASPLSSGPCFFAVWPFSLWCVSWFPEQQWTVISSLPTCRGVAVGAEEARLWGRGGLQQPQPRSQGGELPGWWNRRGWATFHAFILGSLQF